jgi:hypothetical protein
MALLALPFLVGSGFSAARQIADDVPEAPATHAADTPPSATTVGSLPG